jgi:hypothetical protein
LLVVFWKKENIEEAKMNVKNKEALGASDSWCNPSYSGGRDQEDQGSRPAWTNSSQDPILKKIHHKKRAGRVVQVVESLPSKRKFKPQFRQKNKNKEGWRCSSVAEHLPDMS